MDYSTSLLKQIIYGNISFINGRWGISNLNLYVFGINARLNNMNYESIKNLPTTYGGDDRVHESIFKSYHILEYVMKLIERGTDKETIKEIVEYLKS